MHVSEDDVAHERSLGDGDREGEERYAGLRVDAPVDRVHDDATRRVGAESPFPELFRHEHELGAVPVQRLEPPDDRVLRREVDRDRLVAALPRANGSRPPFAGGQLPEQHADVAGRAAAQGKPVGAGDRRID